MTETTTTTPTANQDGATAPVDTTTTQELVTPETKVTDLSADPAPEAGKPEEPATPDESGTDPADEGKPKKKGGGFQDRIDKLTREKYEAEYRMQQVERERDELRKKLDPKPANIPTEKPKIEQFTTVDDYDKAVTEWAREDGKREARQEREQTEQNQKALAIKVAMDAREAQARQKYTDFQQTVDPLGRVLMSIPAVKEYLATEELGMDMAYHLAKNPSKLEELRDMSAYQASRELLKLEARLNAPPPPKPVTKAPDPIKPVGARETVKVTLADLAEKDTDAYVARRRKQEMARRAPKE